jgi:hypothetical protein
MVVRRQVADLYREKVLAGLWTLATVHKLVGIPLETRGANDFDLGYQAGCLGMAMGVFPSLRLTHLMDARRLEEAYLLALLRNNGRAMALLAYVYGGHLPGKAPGWRFVWDRGWSGLLRNEREQRLLDQWREGQRDALKLVSQHAEALASLRASPAASRVS